MRFKAGGIAPGVAVGKVLFPLQIAYKLATWPLVGWANPVVRWNLAIAALHAASVGALLTAR